MEGADSAASDLGMVRNDFRLLLFAFLLSWLTVFPCQARYGGGEGTAEEPYLIYTAADMDEIGTHSGDWSKHFALMSDIDLGGFSGDQFNLIGSSSEPFSGVFDGRGHIIYNFTYNANEVIVGLFRYIDRDAVIKDLGLAEPDVAGFGLVGSIVGVISDGIQPEPASGRIENCRVTGGYVSATFQHAGGLACDVSGGLVVNCYTYGMEIETGSIAGGLAAINDNGHIINSYAANQVEPGSNAGAFIGQGSGGTYTGCFYDNQVNPSLTGIGDSNDPCGLTGETTANMMLGETFVNAGWDIVTSDNQPVRNIWRMCEDGVEYPRLSMEYLDADFACPDGIDLYDLAVFSDEWMQNLLGADVDFNLDGQVNFSDWAIFAAAWRTLIGSENYNPAADVSPKWGDGIIDEYDAALFVESWLDEGLGYLNADIEPYGGDGDVDLADFAAFANLWLEGK
jgi:hypothetical protein